MNNNVTRCTFIQIDGTPTSPVVSRDFSGDGVFKDSTCSVTWDDPGGALPVEFQLSANG